MAAVLRAMIVIGATMMMLTAAVSASAESERQALLESGWRSAVSGSEEQDHCKWLGMTCNGNQSVTRIDLSGYRLITGEVLRKMNFSSLPNLVWLDLSNQVLYGSIPPQLGGLLSLEYLNLSRNSLRGELPSSLGNLNKLLVLDVSFNEGINFISSNLLVDLKNLVSLNLTGNSLVGSIVGLPPNLAYLQLASNPLGVIPPEVWSLKKLVALNMSECRLVDRIPSNITHLTSLQSLSLSSNQLFGPVPPELGKLNNLVFLDLAANNLVGVIPPSVGQLKNLTFLSLASNRFNGTIPLELRDLENLIFLDLSYNRFRGMIPSSVGLLSKLSQLILSSNNLVGSIPTELAGLNNLVKLDLSDNSISASIPLFLCRLSRLEMLNLRQNLLEGSIPLEMGKLKNLQRLDLGANHFTGLVPNEIENLKSLEHLDFSRNRLSGEISSQFVSLLNLTFLNLSCNSLSGPIPNTSNQLRDLDLSHNILSWQIPDTLGYLSSLNLSHNNLSGPVPNNLQTLSSLNLSYNNLSGAIPDTLDAFPDSSFLGSKGLHRPIISPHPEQEKRGHRVSRHLTILLAGTISAAILLSVAFICWLSRRTRSRGGNPSSGKNGDVFSIWNFNGKVAYEDIVQATEGFNIRYCVGTGGSGSVYKARLPNGKVIALKKLRPSEAKEPSLVESFRNEVKMLTGIRHRNIVKLHGFCLHRRSMFLIYEYMERSSLFCVLRNDAGAVKLDWLKRVDAIKNTANALSYLHHDCIPLIVHRDISSNNILLNKKLEAFVSDFGNARLLDPDSSNHTVVAGTYGCWKIWSSDTTTGILSSYSQRYQM